MKRVYDKKKNVVEAANERLEYIFNNFERVYLSFSGGKDSGVMLNLALDYMRANGITQKLGIQIMDNEANYELSMEFMKRIIDDNIDLLDVYWCCMPVTLPCSVSAYDTDWQCWGIDDEKRWVRPMPDMDYVVNYKNHEFGDWFYPNMHYDEFWDGFAEWYSQGKKTANLIGIRTSESLNRFRAIMNDRKVMLDGHQWTKKNTKNVYNVYPIYDWMSNDVWASNALFEWDYNKLYDVFYQAGVPIGSMRVASPFMSEAKSSLNMYRVIDPQIWSRLCARVNGANFIATYGKQLTYSSFDLPEGHTWKSFVKFLLDTLPEAPAANFKARFIQSLKYWGRVGRGLSEDVIADLEKNNVKFEFNGVSNHGGNDLRRVMIKSPPDDLDCLRSNKSAVTSWKRFAITILKNDHTCKYMGLAPTNEQAKRQRAIQKKYRSVK